MFLSSVRGVVGFGNAVLGDDSENGRDGLDAKCANQGRLEVTGNAAHHNSALVRLIELLRLLLLLG